MHDQTKLGLKSLAAILFLGTMGAVLARPIFDSSSNEPRSPQPTHTRVHKEPKKSPKPTRKPKPTPTPSAEPTGAELTLGDRYPSACLHPVNPEGGAGLIAAFRLGDGVDPHQVVIASPAGSRVGSAVIDPPISWSPSGNLLLDRTGVLSTPDGRRAGSAFGERRDIPMMWSPIADCVVGVDGDHLIVGSAGRDPVTLLSGKIDRFSFSQNGTHIIVSGDETRTLDLARHELSNVLPTQIQGPCDRNHFAGYDWPTCSPDGRYIAAVRDNGRLSLLSRDGSFIREIVTDAGYADASPIWGPPRTGIVFVRERVGSPKAPAEIWFVAEGGVPRDTGLRLPPPIKGSVPVPWRGFFDWSVADRPLAPLPVVGD